ncbi:MAG: glycosyltransferase [Planctomycetota bacterium]|nr:glycosyltransferase [Planctomycetota bacterium]
MDRAAAAVARRSLCGGRHLPQGRRRTRPPEPSSRRWTIAGSPRWRTYSLAPAVGRGLHINDMWECAAIIAGALGAVALIAWCGVLLHPARPWDLKPVGEDAEYPPDPARWPDVAVLIPARNEADTIPASLPTVLWQDYPGRFHVFLVDDRSSDGTAEVALEVAEARSAGGRLTVVKGGPLPEGWVGKVWALQQGAAACGLKFAEFSPAGSDVASDKAYVTAASGATERPAKEGTGKDAVGESLGERRNIGKQLEGPPGATAVVGMEGSRPPADFAPEYLLLTDADIVHSADSLRRLVAESEAGRLALNSRTARLRCRSFAEKLLIPPFVFFFNLLYPMRRVEDPESRVAAAAGGCILLARSALEAIGSFRRIRDAIIDDISLAKAVKGVGMPIRLRMSRSDVRSIREYGTVGSVWKMVRRSAFAELRYSWLRLVAAELAMLVVFLVPPALTLLGIALPIVWSGSVETSVPKWWAMVYLVEGLLTWAAMHAAYLPAVAFYGLSQAWAVSLPLAGLMYAAMTADSALACFGRGRARGWR